MDQAYISTLAALGGTIIGGVSSFATSWVNQRMQARMQLLAAERGKREELYGRFLSELAELYAHAVSEESVDYSKLVNVFALKGRMGLFASMTVLQEADQAIKFLVDVYMSSSRSVEEVRAMMDDRAHDPLQRFAAACRTELQRFGRRGR